MIKRIINNIKNPLTPLKLKKKGQSYYSFGKTLMIIGLCGFLLLILLIIGAILLGRGAYIYDLLTFYLGDYEWVAPLLFFAYLEIPLGFLGLPFYFYGMHLYSLGIIAENSNNLKIIAENTKKE